MAIQELDSKEGRKEVCDILEKYILTYALNQSQDTVFGQPSILDYLRQLQHNIDNLDPKRFKAILSKLANALPSPPFTLLCNLINQIRSDRRIENDLTACLLKGTEGVALLSVCASAQDFALVLGHYTTEPKAMLKAKSYLMMPMNSGNVRNLVITLIQQYIDHKMQGVLKVTVPIRHHDVYSGTSHYNLLILKINSIQGEPKLCDITVIDFMGNRTQAVDKLFYENYKDLKQISSQPKWYSWFRIIEKNKVATSCIATDIVTGEQSSRITNDKTCLDRVIQSILSNVGEELSITTLAPYDTRDRAYQGIGGAILLRLVTTKNITMMLEQLKHLDLLTEITGQFKAPQTRLLCSRWQPVTTITPESRIHVSEKYQLPTSPGFK